MTRAHSLRRQHVHRTAARDARRVHQSVDAAAEATAARTSSTHRLLVRHVDVGEEPPLAAAAGPAPGTSPASTGRRPRRGPPRPGAAPPWPGRCPRRRPSRCRSGRPIHAWCLRLVAPGRPGLIGAVHCSSPGGVPGTVPGGSPRHEVRAVLRDPRPPPVGGGQRAHRLPEHAGAGHRRRHATAGTPSGRSSTTSCRSTRTARTPRSSTAPSPRAPRTSGSATASA